MHAHARTHARTGTRTGTRTHLKDVLGPAGEAVVGGAGAAGAHTDLAHLVRLAQVGRPLHPHHTHQGCGRTVMTSAAFSSTRETVAPDLLMLSMKSVQNHNNAAKSTLKRCASYGHCHVTSSGITVLHTTSRDSSHDQK